MKVAFLGPESSFSNEAAKKAFPKEELVPVESISKIFESVESKKTDAGIIPLENSNEGSITQTLDALASTELVIIAETYLEVNQCLLSNEKVSSIKKIFSHPQGFAQCRTWVEKNFPKAELVECASTAGAAKKAAGEKNSAAIASMSAANKFGLKILAKSIQDSADNKTRFAVIVKKDFSGAIKFPPSSKEFKTSLLFGVKDKPGSLFDAIKSFKDYNVNMTKIESRPSRKNAWEYVFFIDISGSIKDEPIMKAIVELNKHCAFIKILGSYKRIE